MGVKLCFLQAMASPIPPFKTFGRKLYKKNKIVSVPKKCHDFNRMPFPRLLMEMIALWTCCSQHLLILFDKKPVKRCNGFLTRGEGPNCLIFVQEQHLVTISSTLQRVWHGRRNVQNMGSAGCRSLRRDSPTQEQCNSAVFWGRKMPCDRNGPWPMSAYVIPATLAMPPTSRILSLLAIQTAH